MPNPTDILSTEHKYKLLPFFVSCLFVFFFELVREQWTKITAYNKAQMLCMATRPKELGIIKWVLVKVIIIITTASDNRWVLTLFTQQKKAPQLHHKQHRAGFSRMTSGSLKKTPIMHLFYNYKGSGVSLIMWSEFSYLSHFNWIWMNVDVFFKEIVQLVLFHLWNLLQYIGSMDTLAQYLGQMGTNQQYPNKESWGLGTGYWALAQSNCWNSLSQEAENWESL